MINKIMALALLSTVLITPTISMAANIAATPAGTIVKMGGAAQVIRLASNDVTQIQDAERKVPTKVSVTDPSTELSKIPPQAWLVLTALFCFVMRSSRRTV